MLTVSNMDKVLRSVYLDVVTNAINDTTSPFYKKIEKSNTNVYGKEINIPYSIGINSGIACVDESDDIPVGQNPSFITFRAPMQNIYGSFEITDKLIRVSEHDVGSVVNLLNFQIEELLRAAKFNLRRMLLQSGDGELCKIAATATGNTYEITVDSTRNIVEGMVIDIIKTDNTTVVVSGVKVSGVDRTSNKLKLDQYVGSTTAITGYRLTVHGSNNKEIYGIPYIFNDDVRSLYGNTKSSYSFLLPGKHTTNGLGTNDIQTVLDSIEADRGVTPDIILSGYDMRRQYLEHMRNRSLNVDYMDLDGGFKSISYNGIPIYTDPFMEEGSMYFLNTGDFVLGQLADWTWLEGVERGILNPVQSKAAYKATLVKYCNLICKNPTAQAKLTYVAPVAPATPDSGDSGNSGDSGTGN